MSLFKTVKRDGDTQPTRYYSKKQEDTVAKQFSGSRVKNSGATRFDKGDVSLDRILLECKTKTTASKSLTIQKEWLEKTEKESLFMGKEHSALAFNFGPNEKNYFIIDEDLFSILISSLNNMN